MANEIKFGTVIKRVLSVQVAEPELTPFFEYTDKPVRKGVYQVTFQRNSKFLYYCYWSGARWCGIAPTVSVALQRKHRRNTVQQKCWRGLFKHAYDRAKELV